jgi:hypothetical protein
MRGGKLCVGPSLRNPQYAPTNRLSQDISVSEECERVQRRVCGFDWRASPAWGQLNCLFGPRLSQSELVSIAELVSEPLKLKLDRDARRRKAVMIKWFEENWSYIVPLLHFVVLDEN